MCLCVPSSINRYLVDQWMSQKYLWLAIASCISMALHSPRGDEMVLVHACVPIQGKELVWSRLSMSLTWISDYNPHLYLSLLSKINSKNSNSIQSLKCIFFLLILVHEETYDYICETTQPSSKSLARCYCVYIEWFVTFSFNCSPLYTCIWKIYWSYCL